MDAPSIRGNCTGHGMTTKEASVKRKSTVELATGSREDQVVLDGRVEVPKIVLRDELVLSSPVFTGAHVSSSQEFFIRLLDVVGAIFILACCIIPMLIISILIKILSPGEVLYEQERVGRRGKIFTLYKFRSMIVGAEEDVGPVLAKEDDERVTTIGRFIRKARIDELPQLFNVLRGDMSLVGPRPERPFFVERHRVLQGVRLAVKPGLTGLAQVRALYNLKPDHKFRYDFLYIQNRSFKLNLYVLMKTIPVLLSKTGW